MNSGETYGEASLASLAATEPDSFVDGPFGSNLKSEEYSTCGVRLIQLQNIGTGSWVDANKKYVSQRKFSTLTRHGAVAGDIAIAKMADPVARACLLPPVAQQFLVVADCIKLRPDHAKCDPRFLIYMLNSEVFTRSAELVSTGTTRLRINLGTLKKLKVLLPPLAKQRRIAEILETVDDAIRSTETLIAKLEQLKQGLLHDLLTRGIDENGELRDPIRNPDQFHTTDLGLLPIKWKARPLGNLLANVDPCMRSGPFGSALLKAELVSDGVPMLGIDNVNVEQFVPMFSRFVTRQKFHELSRYAVRPNDIMITIMGTVGRCCEVPSDIGNALSSKHVWTLTIDQTIYLPFLVCLQVNHSDWVLRHFSKDTQGGIMSAIRSETLRSVLLPTPPIQEQVKIASLLSTENERLASLRAELAKLRLLKVGLMDDLLTGRVRVKVDDQDTA